MESRNAAPERKKEFLNQVANDYGFFQKTREVFLARFDEEQAASKNTEIANYLGMPPQEFQDYLRKICDKLGFSSNGKGRCRKGESPWEKAFTWLWNEKFRECFPDDPQLFTATPTPNSQPLTTHPSTDNQLVDVAKREFPEGQVAVNYAIYVERPQIENTCYETLVQPGSLIRIKAPQQMGKTYLISRVLAQLAKKSYKTVSLSFKLADQAHFDSLDNLLRWLSIKVSRDVGLPNQLDDYWDEEGIGSKSSCTEYFEEYLLPQVESSLVLCLDDVDLVFLNLKNYEDFFGLLRSWYDKAQSRPIWKKLRLVVVHSTEVYMLKDINQSPFNVGIPIELPEFSIEQVQYFAKQHELDWDAAPAEQLMKMVGGHPYLVQQALFNLRTRPNMTLEQLLKDAPTEAGIYRNHLRQQLLSLEQRPELVEALKHVVTTTSSVRLETTQAYQLLSMGLVKLKGNDVQPRCNLYRQYFCDRLRDI